MHTLPHREVSHQYQEATGSQTETGHNAETPGHWRDLHLFAVSLAGWQKYHLQIPHPVCRAILAEFKDEYLCCPDTLDECKRIKKKFRTRCNVPHTVGAIDGKHIAMKKLKKSGSDYYNYKGFFSLVLLGLVVAENRFLWIDCDSSGSYSDADFHQK